jgi:hypothetical protein
MKPEPWLERKGGNAASALSSAEHCTVVLSSFSWCQRQPAWSVSECDVLPQQTFVRAEWLDGWKGIHRWVWEVETKRFEGVMEGIDSWCIVQWHQYIIKHNQMRFKLMNECCSNTDRELHLLSISVFIAVDFLFADTNTSCTVLL